MYVRLSMCVCLYVYVYLHETITTIKISNISTLPKVCSCPFVIPPFPPSPPPLSLSCHYRRVFIVYSFIEVESNRMHSFSPASFTHRIILRFIWFVAWINSPFLSKLNSIPLCVYTTILPVHLLMNIWAGFGYYK